MEIAPILEDSFNAAMLTMIAVRQELLHYRKLVPQLQQADAALEQAKTHIIKLEAEIVDLKTPTEAED